MKYIKFAESNNVNVILTVVFALIGAGVIAYGAGYLAGVVTKCLE